MNRFSHGIAVAAGATVTGIFVLLAGVVTAPPSPGTALAAPRAPATVTAQVAGARAVAWVPPKRTLRYGMSGNDVKVLQQRLTALKYYPGKVDGRFGQYTLEAVWAFQEVQGIGVDGVVGPITKRALVSPRAYPSHYPRGGALRVEVNLKTRVLVVYQSNRVALISHISAGGGYRYCGSNGCGYAVTPTGRFRTTVFMPGWIRVPLGLMYDPVFFIRTSYAIHGSNSVPLNPVSHGCVRIPMDIAPFFHTMIRTPGTPVYVYR